MFQYHDTLLSLPVLLHSRTGGGGGGSSIGSRITPASKKTKQNAEKGYVFQGRPGAEHALREEGVKITKILEKKGKSLWSLIRVLKYVRLYVERVSKSLWSEFQLCDYTWKGWQKYININSNISGLNPKFVLET